MLLKSGIIVGIFTFLSRILGFVRDMVITSIFGASIAADCFNIAFRLPNFFRRIFAEGAFSSAFVPIYAAKIQTSPQEATKFASNAFLMLSLCLLTCVLLLELFVPWLVYVLAPGFSAKHHADAIALTIDLCRITLPYLFFVSLAAFFGGILNSHGKFASYAASPIFLNLTLIAFLLLNISGEQIYSLGWGVFVAGIIQLSLMLYATIKSGHMIKLQPIKLKDPELKKLFKNMIPSIIGGGVMQINILVDQAIASFLPAGAISILIYADRINQLPLALIGTAIGTVLLPSLSKYFRTQNQNKALYMQNRAIEIALLLSIPSAFGLIIGADVFCKMLYQRGNFSALDTSNTFAALRVFSCGLPGYVLVKVLLPNFFANGDTKTPLKISVICLLANVINSLIFINFFAHLGIALATAISAWLNAFLLYYYLKRKN
jgi:putative peptidoglycan lipid II flippase